jgi:hypothetical protein
MILSAPIRLSGIPYNYVCSQVLDGQLCVVLAPVSRDGGAMRAVPVDDLPASVRRALRLDVPRETLEGVTEAVGETAGSGAGERVPHCINRGDARSTASEQVCGAKHEPCHGANQGPCQPVAGRQRAGRSAGGRVPGERAAGRMGHPRRADGPSRRTGVPLHQHERTSLWALLCTLAVLTLLFGCN